jgi:hypothetical protein
MDWFTASLQIATGVVLVVAYAATYKRSQQSKQIHKLQDAWGLDPANTPPPNIVRSVLTLSRGGLVGVAAGGAVSFAITDVSDTTSDLNFYLIYGTVTVGAALGFTISAGVLEARRVRGLVRIARAQAVSLDDYVPRSLRGLLWGVVGLCISRIAVGIALADAYPSRYVGARQNVTHYLFSSVTIVVGQLATLALLEVVSRLFIRHGQFASSSSELVWGDALRGQVFYSMLLSPLVVAGVGIVQSFAILGFTNTPSLVQIVVNVLFGLALVLLAILGFRSQANTPRQQFLRRLWPDLYEARRHVATTEWTRASLELQTENAARAAGKWARRHPAAKVGGQQ